MTTSIENADITYTPIENAHPGTVLREEFLKPAGISAYRLAQATGLARGHVNDLLRARRNITPDTAILLAEAVGMTASFWLRLQAQYDLIAAER